MERLPGVDEREVARVLALLRLGKAQTNIVPFLSTAQTPRIAQVLNFRPHSLLDVLPAAVYTTGAAGRITYYNAAAVALWGRRPVPDVSEWCGAFKLYWPDGTRVPFTSCPTPTAR